MTKRVLAVLCALGISLASVSAQTPAPSRPPSTPGSPEAHRPVDVNYVLTLSPVQKDGEGVSVIVTPPQTFNVSRTGLTFNGTLSLTESGVYRLDYLLETNAEHGGTIHTGASVVLTPGEPVQLVKNGEQFYNLRLDRYPPPEGAGGSAH